MLHTVTAGCSYGHTLELTDEQSTDILLDEISSPQTRKKRVRHIMKTTFKQRRSWIMKECPPVSEVLLKYPPLKSHKLVSMICMKDYNTCMNKACEFVL